MATLLDEDGLPLLDEDGLPLLDTIPVPPAGPEPVFRPPVPAWSVDLLRAGQRIAMVDNYTFTGLERYNAAGEWLLETTPGSVTEWQPTGLIVNGLPTMYGPRDVDAVRLVRDAELVYAGLVSQVSEGVGGFEVNRNQDRTIWKWSGPDLWGILNTRNAYPDPTTEPPWAVTHDIQTGLGSTALTAYLRRNLGADALPDRQWPGIDIEDLLAGVSGEWSARLQTLQDLAQRVTGDAGFRCRPRMEFDGSIIFRLDAPLNLSSVFVFSDQSDLADVHMRWVPVTTTSVIAGGQGEGTARAFARSATSDAGAARVETFSEQTSLVAAGELARSAAATRARGAATWVVDAQVTDSVSSSVRYGTDFAVGDTIGIEVDNVRYQVPIVAARFEIGVTRQVVRPVLGTGVPDELAGLLKDVANLADRLNRDVP